MNSAIQIFILSYIFIDATLGRLDTFIMNIRKELERKVERKRDEVATAERSLAESKAYLQALEDMLKMLPKNDLQEDNPDVYVLRQGTEVAKIEGILRNEGKPLHIDELMKRLGKDEKFKISLSGSLSSYVRQRKVFTRPQPNTFGLIEFPSQSSGKNEPPEDFGLLKED